VKKFIFFELIKGVIAFVLCFLIFSVLPFSVYILLIPIDILAWWLLRKRMQPGEWILLLIITYIVVTVACFIWIITGHRDTVEFLLDFDHWH